MQKNIILVFILVFLAKYGFACLPDSTPTESITPVTIKIADTYFQIPEKYIQHLFMRAPKEQEAIWIYIPLKDVIKNISKDSFDNSGAIFIFDSGNKNSEEKDILLNERVAMRIQTLARGTERIEILNKLDKYVRSISSESVPETWKKDNKLSEELNLGTDPCLHFYPKLQQTNKPKIPPSDTVIAALNHRNEAVIVGAMQYLELVFNNNNKEITKKILHLYQKSNSYNVKKATVRALFDISEYNKALISKLLQILKTEENMLIRGEIVRAISKFGGEDIFHKMSKLKKEEVYLYDEIIANSLIKKLQSEINEDNLTYNELNDNTKKILDWLIVISQETNNPNVSSNILGVFGELISSGAKLTLEFAP